jgi:RluA family pseudouridine synthase
VKRRVQSRIPLVADGELLLDYLAGRFTYHSPELWSGRIISQRLLVNDVVADMSCVLKAGDLVEFIADDILEPDVNFDVRIVHADDDIMVIDKPANLPCHPAGRYFNHTVWAWLKKNHGVKKPAIINRLDRETSGLLIVALNPVAESRCRRQFAARRVEKEYLVLVEGEFPESMDAHGWIMQDPEAGTARRRVFQLGGGAKTDEADWAETRFVRLAAGNGVSLVRAEPNTGRLHQIRATLCSLGFPVVGDKVYGVDSGMFVRFCTDMLSEEDWQRLRVKRQALHASRLEFRHPGDQRVMSFESPLPEELVRVIGKQE